MSEANRIWIVDCRTVSYITFSFCYIGNTHLYETSKEKKSTNNNQQQTMQAILAEANNKLSFPLLQPANKQQHSKSCRKQTTLGAAHPSSYKHHMQQAQGTRQCAKKMGLDILISWPIIQQFYFILLKIFPLKLLHFQIIRMYFEIHTGREKNLRYERGGIGAVDLMGERGVQLANLATCVSYLSYMEVIYTSHCNHTRVAL